METTRTNNAADTKRAEDLATHRARSSRVRPRMVSPGAGRRTEESQNEKHADRCPEGTSDRAPRTRRRARAVGRCDARGLFEQFEIGRRRRGHLNCPDAV